MPPRDSAACAKGIRLTVGHLGTIVLLTLFGNLLCQSCADFSLNRSAIDF
jgi:hypothetical protein